MTTTTLPEIGTVQNREDLLAAVDSRTRRAAVLRQAGGGPIVGLALTPDRNPEAPDRMALGDGDRPQREARTMIDQGTPLPVWVRAASGWTYTGQRMPARLVDDDSVLLLAPVPE